MIENNKLIESIIKAGIADNIVSQYKSEFLRLNALVRVIKSADNFTENTQLEAAIKQIETYITTIESSPNNYADSYIRQIKTQTDIIKNIALEVLLTSPTFLEYIKDDTARSESIDTLKKEKVITDKQIKTLQNALKNVDEVISGGTSKVIASQIDMRIKELEFKEEGKDPNKNEQSAQFWMKKRDYAFKILIAILVTVFAFFGYLIFCTNISTEQLYAISVVKIAFIGLFYSQYYFAQKNYRIYADLLSKYRHIQLNAKILENYLMIEGLDQDLKKQLILKVTDLISNPVNSHHFKDTDSKGIINNIIPFEKILNNQD